MDCFINYPIASFRECYKDCFKNLSKNSSRNISKNFLRIPSTELFIEFSHEFLQAILRFFYFIINFQGIIIVFQGLDLVFPEFLEEFLLGIPHFALIFLKLAYAWIDTEILSEIHLGITFRQIFFNKIFHWSLHKYLI